MLLEDGAIGETVTVLRDMAGQAFWFDRHQTLYDHIIDLWNRSRPLDGVLIKDELEQRGLFEPLGGYEFLGSLVGAVPSALRAREYATIVRDKALLRQLIHAAEKAMDIAFEDGLPTQEILDAVSREIFAVTERGVSGAALPLPDVIDEVFHRIEELDGKVLTGKPTGYYELDELTCGLQPSELIIVAGRPSMGKTALGLNMAEHMALNEDLSVLFFSLEMSRQQVAQRLLCSRARVDSHRLRRGRLSGDDIRRLHDAADAMRRKKLLIDDTSSLTILELRARARLEARRARGLDAIFVDYLQLLRAPHTESRQQEVAEISRGLKALAKELNIPVIAMAQLNRKTEDRTGNRPRMSDLRESGSIEQDADVVAMLHRESYYTTRGSDDAAAPDDEDSGAELIIAKQRNGPVDTIKLHFNKSCTRFENPDLSGRFGDGPPPGRDDYKFP